jgi:hypothetical protein
MSSTVTTATVAAVTGISHTPGLARMVALAVLLVICLVLILREATAGTRAASLRRFRSGLVICLVPLACVAGLTMMVDKHTINQLTPAISPARERQLMARHRIRHNPAAAFARADLTAPTR